MAATIAGAFFGCGFFSPSVSPVLLNRFLVPVATLSKADGGFFVALVL